MAAGPESLHALLGISGRLAENTAHAQVVVELVAERFGVKLSLASVGTLLAELGLTPQKPLMRAYERDPAAIEAWKRVHLSEHCGTGQTPRSGDLFLG